MGTDEGEQPANQSFEVILAGVHRAQKLRRPLRLAISRSRVDGLRPTRVVLRNMRDLRRLLPISCSGTREEQTAHTVHPRELEHATSCFYVAIECRYRLVHSRVEMGFGRGVNNELELALGKFERT